MGVMLKISGAEKTFGRGTANEHKVLNRLDLELKSGEFVTLLGSNGAGKTTLFNAVCGNFLWMKAPFLWTERILLFARSMSGP